MIGKLYSYFGIIGISSILAWAAALGLFAWFARRRERTKWYWIAAGLALLGLLTARINSHYVSAIEVDRSADIAAGIERQKQLRAKLASEAGEKAAKIRFAEDAPTEHLDMAGVRDASQLDKYEAAALATEEDKYDYRRRGKQQRAVATAAATGTAAVVEAPVVEAKQARTMLEPDVVNANRLDRFNLLFARLAFWLALGLVSFDYLSRFNRTRDHLWPLPISGHYLDNLWPKRLSTWFRSANPETLRDYLENVVRKGENFILCSSVDPWADAAALPRLTLRDWAWWPRWKLVCGKDDQHHDDEFLFEAAWFQRYAVVITDRARAEQALRSFAELLAMRQRTGARARQTVHLVWAEPAPPSAELLDRLLQLCPGANLKLVLTTPGSPVPENRFAEVL
jgi:hypothetical protein